MTRLCLVAGAVDDEFLSSWLDRTATLHGVQRQHLLEWSGYRGSLKQGIDDTIVGKDLMALARLMRASESEICAHTHHGLGQLRNEVTCRTRIHISCRGCDDRLRALHGVRVRLKHWTEAWRIRCRMCGDMLSQTGEEEFEHELKWHWYEPIIAAADRGSTMVAEAIDFRCAGDVRHERVSARAVLPTMCRLLPRAVLSLFRLDGSEQNRPTALSSLSFARRFFLLAAIGFERRAGAEHARHLFDVWLENRRLRRQTRRRRRQRRALSSLKMNV